MTPPLTAALFYAKRLSWKPFPTRPKQKVPQIDRWPERATRDEKTIRHWWAETPDAGIGIATGATSGVVVLNIDPEKGGEESLQALIDHYGVLPDTVESLTGSGGRHIYFAHPGRPIRNSAGKLGAGLDVRGDGGYVIVPPSIHPNGESYRWEASSVPGRVSLAPLPGWLLEKLTEPEPKPTANSNGINGTVPAGQRNAHLASLAGAMRRPGMSPEAIEAALQTENVQRCSPPLPKDEVHAIAVSISRYSPGPEGPAARGQTQDRTEASTSAPTSPTGGVTTEDWPEPLSKEAYHGLAGEIVGTIQPHTESDPAAILVQLITAFGNCIGNSPHYQVEGTRHTPNLFVALVGSTSKARKGTSWGADYSVGAFGRGSMVRALRSERTLQRRRSDLGCTRSHHP